jgi:hypothetical protein
LQHPTAGETASHFSAIFCLFGCLVVCLFLFIYFSLFRGSESFLLCAESSVDKTRWIQAIKAWQRTHLSKLEVQQIWVDDDENDVSGSVIALNTPTSVPSPFPQMSC